MEISKLQLGAAGLAACALGVAAWTWADEVTIPLEKAPEAVKAALAKLAGGAKVEKLEQDGQTYEGTWGNGAHSAEMTEGGDLLELADETKEAPKAVLDAAKKLFPDAKKVKLIKECVYLYEIEAGNQEIVVTPSGRAVKLVAAQKPEEEKD